MFNSWVPYSSQNGKDCKETHKESIRVDNASVHNFHHETCLDSSKYNVCQPEELRLQVGIGRVNFIPGYQRNPRTCCWSSDGGSQEYDETPFTILCRDQLRLRKGLTWEIAISVWAKYERNTAHMIRQNWKKHLKHVHSVIFVPAHPM